MCGNLPSTSPSAAKCLFLGVDQPEDVGLLCVHFQPMNEPARTDRHHDEFALRSAKDA